MLEDALKEENEGVKITLEVIPNAKKREIGYDEWRKAIMIKVMNPPKKGKANREVIDVLSEIFNTHVEIVSGHTSSKKAVFVDNKTKDEVVNVLKRVIHD